MLQSELLILGHGDTQFPRQDTASFADLPDGRLFVVWNRYEAGPHGGHDRGSCHVASAYSSDRGRTWSAPRILLRPQANDHNVQVPVLRLLPDGRLFMICLRAQHDFTESAMQLLESTDLGQTFTHSTYIWPFTPKRYWLQGGAGLLLRLRNGRLLVPCHGGSGQQWAQHNAARCLYSDDTGRTWQISNEIDLPKRGAMEASVAELPDETLVMSLRTQLGSVHFSRSLNHGATWTPAVPSDLQASESCTCLRCIPNTSRLLLIWNDTPYDPSHHHFGLRTPISLAVSDDAGETWKRLGNLDHQPNTDFTNINCDFLTDGRAAISYMVNTPSFSRDRMDLHVRFLDTKQLLK